MLENRFVRVVSLVGIYLLLTLPNLGAPSLWDMDEGVNAECTREMIESGSWVIPTFNWELRVAKPILTYWIQRPAMLLWGPTEFAARFPSVLLGLGTVLVTYDLARRMFDSLTGWLSGIALASAVQFNLLSHAATPDASLIFFTTLTFYSVWVGHHNGARWWFLPAAAASGFAVLAKGPIGLAIPGLVVLLYLLWCRDWWRIFDLRLLWGFLLFAAVALPWYILITAETRGEYLRRFLGNENVNRFSSAMEGHDGWPTYYFVAFAVMFAPWSCFVGATFWYGVQGARRFQIEPITTEQRAHRFLLCWFFAFFLFFTAASTKLPNYIGPLYPAAAVLTARFLTRWSDKSIAPARWIMPAGTAFVAVTGIAFAAGFLIVSGAVEVNIKGLRLFPGLEYWSPIGLIPVVCAAVMAYGLKRDNRPLVLGGLVVAAVGLIGITAAGPVLVVDRQKAAKELVLTSGALQTHREIHLGSHGYFQESLVFYAQRKVNKLATPEDVVAFLQTYPAAYLFIPEKQWLELQSKVPVPTRIAARKYDFYKNELIVVITNEVSP